MFSIAVHPRTHCQALAIAAALAGAGTATPALAAPGAGEEVYAATVDPHEVELEARYGRLTGGNTGGDDNARIEASYGVTSNLSIAATAEFEHSAADSPDHRLTHVGIEAVLHVARIAGIDIAAYQEFEVGFNSNPDASETKLLLERRTRLWDVRFNLIGEKPLDSRLPLQFGYAASADVAITRTLRIGATAFGDLGTAGRFAPYAQHYVGPTLKWRILPDDPGLEIETGYLFAVAQARQEAAGQFRINVEVEL